MNRAAALALLALAAAGCATVEQALPRALRPSSSLAESAAPTPGLELVAYLARLRGLNERALAGEASRQREMARGSPTDIAQVKIAIALSLTTQADEGEVIGLVEPVAKREGADDDVRAMASFLHIQALERRRLRESATAANTRLRDERKAAEAQKQRADALQERAVQLQQKIDALTEIEKSLSDRQVQGR